MSIVTWSRLLTAAVMLATPLAAQTTPPPARDAISVHVGSRSTTLSRAELTALARRTIALAAEGDTTTVSGISLWDVLQKVGVPSTTASGRQRATTYLRLTGSDGQRAVVALVEVDPSFSQRIVLIADRRGDRALDDVEGPWRAIIPDDRRHARWIRGLVSITVETLQD